MHSMMPSCPPGRAERTDVVAAMAAADTFLAAFKKPAAGMWFLVLNQEDFLPEIDGPAILFPVEPGGDQKALLNLLDTTLPKAPGAKISILKDGVLVLGTDGLLKQLQSIKPQPRPDLMLIDDNWALEAVAAVPPGSAAGDRRTAAFASGTIGRRIITMVLARSSRRAFDGDASAKDAGDTAIQRPNHHYHARFTIDASGTWQCGLRRCGIPV